MDNMVLKFKALADKNRLRIFNALAHHGELCACQITELLSVTGATVSRHLGLMVRAGLLKSRKDGRWVLFRLDDSPEKMKDVRRWVEAGLKESEESQRDLNALKHIMAQDREDICRKQRGEACCPWPASRLPDHVK